MTTPADSSAWSLESLLTVESTRFDTSEERLPGIARDVQPPAIRVLGVPNSHGLRKVDDLDASAVSAAVGALTPSCLIKRGRVHGCPFIVPPSASVVISATESAGLNP